MDSRAHALERAWLLALTCGLTGTVTFSLSDMLGLAVPRPAILTALLASVATGFLLATQRRFALHLGIALLGSLLAAVLAVGPFPALATVSRLPAVVAGAFLKGQAPDRVSSWVLALVLPLGASWLFCVALFRFRQPLWVMFAGSAIFVLEWACYYDGAQLALTVFLIIGMLAVVTIRTAQVRESAAAATTTDISPVRAAAMALPFVLVVAIAAQVLPHHFRPIDLGALEERFVELFPSSVEMRGPARRGTTLSYVLAHEFSLTGSRRERETQLGAGVPGGSSVSLRLQLDKTYPLDTLYLKGVTRDTYTGHSWRVSRGTMSEYGPGSVLPSSWGKDASCVHVTYTVTHLGVRTSTLFTLHEPVTARPPSARFLADPLSNLLARDVVPLQEPYSVVSAVDLTGEARIKRAEGPDLRHQQFLQIPRTVTGRVRELAASVTAGLDHPFDKARAIEQFLRVNYRYSRTCPRAPADTDFVDHFLFELRYGPCTHHSTAMAVMLRCVGVPSRWVEGFVTPPLSPPRAIEVTENDAHAWVEAYMPGYGWVTFDPTPNTSVPRRDYPPAGQLRPGPPNQEGEDTGAGREERRARPPEDGESVPDLARWPISRRYAGYATVVCLALLALRICSRAVAILPENRLSLRRPREAVRNAYAVSCAVLARFDLGRKPSLTPREYSRWLNERSAGVGRLMSSLTDLYEQAQYSRAQTTPDAAQLAAVTLRRLKAAVAARVGLPGYLLRRLIL